MLKSGSLKAFFGIFTAKDRFDSWATRGEN